MDATEPKRIAMLFPYAPKYREPIYQLMDRELDVDWYFCGNAIRDLKLFDYSLLKNVDLSMRETRVAGPFARYSGLSHIPLEDYDALVIAGVYQNLSEWRIALRYGRCRKKPDLYFWTHGMYGKESGFRSAVKKFLYRSAQGVFLYGEHAKKIMMEEGFDGSTLHVIHNSLDYDRQLEIRRNLKPSEVYREHFGNDDRVLVFIGRLNPVKKLDMAVRAVADLKEKGERYNLVFVGDGPERENLSRLAERLGVKDSVWFYGESYDELKNAELLYNADLCVSPGNIGLTAVHVMTFGCPALTHDCFSRQMPEFEAIRPGRTGDFYRYGSQSSLEEKISQWLGADGLPRDEVRRNCYGEIDSRWTPKFQLDVLKHVLG